MTLRDFLEKSRLQLERNGASALPDIAGEFIVRGLSKLPFIGRVGTNVYDREWDILVILDACRTDVYRETINDGADQIWSVGSSSEEWMENTFREVDTSGTAYITGNVFSREQLSRNEFHTLDEVWEYGWSDELGTIPPRPITDRAIDVWRNDSPNRMIVHYMQPHYPFIGSERSLGRMERESFGENGDVNENDVWMKLQMGKLERDEVWNSYVDNLQFVWQEVKLLSENVSGKAAVTADHGNSFGKWGVYGHPAGLPAPELRQVPWDTFDCTDEQTRTPERHTETEATDEDVTERLEKLGYT